MFIIRIHGEIWPDIAERLTKHSIVEMLRNRLILYKKIQFVKNK